jgi:hypothetical protein
MRVTEDRSFADRIRARFPEGLTGVFAVGGTRTGFILEKNRNNTDPGAISDFSLYARYSLDQYFRIIKDFIVLGGQHMVINLSDHRLFAVRGEAYARALSEFCLWLTNDESVEFYRQNHISPYFLGIDALRHLPEDHFAHQSAAVLVAFQQNWKTEEGDHKVIWEIGIIPLFSFWRAHEVMGAQAQAELQAQLEQATDLQTIHDLTYKYYARSAYGTDLPSPHFYIGTNRNGDLKLRALLPIALLCNDPFRLYFTPYPSLFMTKETLKAILEDLAFGKPLRSTKIDYSGQVTSELLEEEYARVQELSSDPFSTLGLVREMRNDD